MADTTLNDVVKTLQKGQARDEQMAKNFEAWFKAQERARLDALEEKRERKKAKPESVERARRKDTGKDNTSLGFLALGRLVGPLGAFIAGFTALGAALAGFRGWELKAIKSLDKFGGFSKALDQKFINLRAKFFNKLGLDPKLGKAVDGKRSLATPLTTQLNNRMNTWFSNLQQKYFKIFGLGVDGKPIAVQGDDGKIKPKSIMARLGVRINSIFRPITKMSSAIGAWFTGAGAKVVNFGKNFLGKGGAFLKLMGKIMWPIGILISAFDGMKAYMASDEATTFGKFGDGIAGMVGSFIGAPFDLIKSAFLWIIRKITGAEVDENGNYDTSTTSGKILQAAKDFSFTEMITKMVKSPFTAILNVVDWVKSKFAIFSDEGEGGGFGSMMKSILDDALTALGYKKGMSVLEIIGQIVTAPATAGIKWIASKFGFEAPENFTLNPVTIIKQYGNDAFAWVASKFGFEISDDDFSVTGWIKNKWDEAVVKMQNAFLDLGLWMSMIGPKLKVMAVEAIKSYTGNWIIDDSTLEELQADVDRRENQAQMLRDQLTIQQNKNSAEDITPEVVPEPAPVIVVDGSSGDTDASSTTINQLRIPMNNGGDAFRDEHGLVRIPISPFN